MTNAGHFIQANGARYFVAGSDSATSNPVVKTRKEQGKHPLLLLHGFTGSSQNWELVRTKLAVHSRPTWAVDLLGHGKSEAPTNSDRYQMEFAAADIIDILAQLNIPKCHLLGYSMGGRLALYLAVHYPNQFQTLILESSSPGLATQAERNARMDKDGQLANRIEQKGIAAFVQFWESLALWDSQQHLRPEVRQAVRDGRLKNTATGLGNSLRGMGTGVQPSLWNKLPYLNLPSHLIVGEEDSKFCRINRQMAQRMPNASLTTIKKAGHTVHLEQPELYVSLLHDYLSKIEKQD